ncbi:MAG TPA: redoxin domain-containing protein [Rubrobacteraceae bacterium]|nr:redoxin domain-containing protein [Rubrobacteraceae bacterium]
MKRLAVIALIVVVAAVTYRSLGSAETGTGSLTLPQPAPNEGAVAPQFTAQTTDDERFVLSDEGTYVLTFWSTLNEGSNKARAGFTSLAEEYGDEGVSFAAVYVNGPPTSGDAPFTILQDTTGRLASLYNVKRVPRTFLIRDGKVVLVHNGYYEENKEDLAEALEDVLEDS